MFGNVRRAYKRYRWFNKNYLSVKAKRNPFPLLWDLYQAERHL